MPDWKVQIQRFLAKLKLEPSREAEIIEELSQHLNDRYEELVSGGSSEEQAFTSVIEELNGGKLASELRGLVKRHRPAIAPGQPAGENRMAELWQNLRYAARLLRLNPGFSAIVILSLALGIGANTAIFQLLNAVRLRSLPVENPQELANVKIVKSPQGRTGAFVGSNPQMTYAIWQQVRNQQQGFSRLGVWYSQRLNLSRGGEERYARGMFVSGSYFDTMKVRPVAGRLISEADDQPNCVSSGVVINESFWEREYARSNSVLGKTISLEGHPFEIMGVSPATFFGVEVGRNFDVALPLCAERFIHIEEPFANNLQMWWLAAIGRLKSGWTIERASIQLAAISRSVFEVTIPAEYDALAKKSYREMELGAIPAGNGVTSLRREYENPLWLLLALSGFVLLIACANLANLMVARANTRQREMAVRLALGASRARLIRQMLVESLMLAAIGAMSGAVLAQVLSRVLTSLLSTERTILFLNLQADWRVIAFTSGLAIVTCIFFGLMPAIQASRTLPAEAMKANSRSITGGVGHIASRQLLVVSQVALSLVLLIGALLFVRTLHNLLSLDAGFQQDRMLLSMFDFSALKLAPERRIAYKREFLERIRTMRSVESASSVAVIPLTGSGWNESISIPELTVSRQIANFNQVSSGYFKTVGTRLLSGRDFGGTDTLESPLVAIVTQTFVNKFVKGRNPVGVRFRVIQAEGKPDKVFEIVGLVNDTKYTNLREEFTPIVFVPDTQDSNPDQELSVLIRSNDSILNVISSVKSGVGEINPNITVLFRNFRRLVRDGLLRERLMATLSGFFGFLAAILAMIGLYGVISYMTVQRRHEIGIRIALGANRRNILSMILREAGTLLVAGILIGTLLAFIMGRAAQALLFGMQPNDPFTVILAVIGLGAIAILASFLPARRASALNPMQALREE